jgi:hypothetical protein
MTRPAATTSTRCTGSSRPRYSRSSDHYPPGTADEPAERRENSETPYVTIWHTTVGDALYIRSALGLENGWFRRARRARPGRIDTGVHYGCHLELADPGPPERTSTPRCTESSTGSASTDRAIGSLSQRCRSWKSVSHRVPLWAFFASSPVRLGFGIPNCYLRPRSVAPSTGSLGPAAGVGLPLARCG